MIVLIQLIQGAIESAVLTLFDYLSLHVILCLVPAFFIAGAMAYFVPKDFIMRYMGNKADPKIAYPMATTAGFLLAVCSCTVLPLFVGIWKRGAGLGPAITFLFVAPAINILALTYTGTLVGLDVAIARALLAIIFALLIGIIMAKVFSNETEHTENSQDTANYENSPIQNVSIRNSAPDIFTMSLIAILGVLSILLAVLDTYLITQIGNTLISGIPILNLLFSYPSVLQTIIFLFGLIILVILSYRITSKELNLFLWLIYILMTGTSQIAYFAEDIEVLGLFLTPSITNMLVKIILTAIVFIGLLLFTWRRFDSEDIKAWFMETWIFV
ncbi:MAG: permease, partial [Candidatus Hodarchaeota archaeon]